jgi:hypothetical protein
MNAMWQGIRRKNGSGKIVWGASALMALSLMGCSEFPTTPRENGSVPTTIQVAESALVLESLSEARRLTVELKDGRGRTVHAPVTWESENPGVATVDASGRVRAVSNGSTRVRVRSGEAGGIGASNLTYRTTAPETSVEVIVYQRAHEVRVVASPAPLRSIGARAQLAVEVRDPSGTLLERPFAVVWGSETPGVVGVNASGQVTALEDGMGLVRARVEEASTDVTLEVDATLRYNACAAAGISGVSQARNFLASANATGCGTLPLLRRSLTVPDEDAGEGS